MTGRLRERGDQGNYRGLVPSLPELQQSGPRIRQHYKGRTKKEPTIAWSRAEKAEPTLSSPSSLPDATKGRYGDCSILWRGTPLQG